MSRVFEPLDDQDLAYSSHGAPEMTAAEIAVRAKRKAGEALLLLERATPQTARITSNVGGDRTDYGKALGRTLHGVRDRVASAAAGTYPTLKALETSSYANGLRLDQS